MTPDQTRWTLHTRHVEFWTACQGHQGPIAGATLKLSLYLNREGSPQRHTLCEP
jgi:hypothetical protein